MENPVGKKPWFRSCPQEGANAKSWCGRGKSSLCEETQEFWEENLTFLQEEGPLECNSWSVIHNQHNEYWLVASSPEQKNWAGVELGGCLLKQLQLPGAVVVEG